MRKTLALLVAFCALPGFAQLQEEQSTGVIEKWQCLNVMDWLMYQFDDAGWDDIPGDKIVVTLTRSTAKDHKSGSGEVSITGITHRARFSVEGLERRWDFGENGEYAFFINPQGGGAYFDFSDAEVGEKVEPSLTLGCINEAEARRKAEESRKLAEEAAAAQRQSEETERRRREAEIAERMRREMEEERQRAVEGDYLPIVKVAPMYPRRAQSRGLEGYCDLEFTVTPLGTTSDVRVISCTSSLFERASIQALLKFKYKPRVVNGTAIAIPGLRRRITFQIE